MGRVGINVSKIGGMVAVGGGADCWVLVGVGVMVAVPVAVPVGASGGRVGASVAVSMGGWVGKGVLLGAVVAVAWGVSVTTWVGKGVGVPAPQAKVNNSKRLKKSNPCFILLLLIRIIRIGAVHFNSVL